ncbi:lysophospholipase-like protein 1 [Chelonus insularis]|uniref:lysophospholipase-like protein 1 n=1 Tax=Chelonus insularis TaxID=460826 RepID=UPI00158D21A5|nr:lysophospholipase-like protein 1 [Chelonus insularis]
MANVLKLQNIINVQASVQHLATLFILHGSGSSGNDMKMWIDVLNREELKFPYVKIVYPTAPSQPYTPLDGMESNVWFDRLDISKTVPEKKESINQICEIMSELIDKEVEAGIPIQKIMLSGFSMGGALALHLAYRYRTSIAGCVAMSTFLNDNSLVYEAIKNNNGTKLPPLLQFHGLKDSLVPFKWGETTYKILKELNVDCKLIPIPNADHELVQTEIKQFTEHILNTLSNEHNPKL